MSEQVKQASRLGQLYRIKERLIKKRDIYKKDVWEAQNKLTEVNNTIIELEQKIENFEGKDLQITEHAFRRWVERIGNNTEEEIKKRILVPELYKMVNVLGNNGTYPLDGFIVVVKDRKVITILTPEMK